jgi:hypothetical protein
VSRLPVVCTPPISLFPDLVPHSHILRVMSGRPGSSEYWGVDGSVGKRCQARRDEEKMEPGVYVLRFETKVMRQTVKYTMNQHQNGWKR